MIAFTYSAKSEQERFSLRFNACTHDVGTWKEEVYAAARAIAEGSKKPLWVCSSGGYDSELVCRAFYDQKIPFSVLTLEHTEGTNRYDIRFAVDWCKKNGVTHKIVPIDMRKFLSDEVKKYADRYAAVHPFRYLQFRLMEVVEEMGGYAVLGGGEQLYAADTAKGKLARKDMYIPFSNGVVLPLQWCDDNATEHVPYFYFTTPELCLSYIRQPIVQFALANPDPLFRHQANAYTLKRLVYQSAWPDLVPRYKANGFDAIPGPLEEAREYLRKKFWSKYIPFNMPVTEFERQLIGTPA